MSLTRAQVEEILVNRCGGWLRSAELDHATHDGTNGDLNDPIGRSVRIMGGTVADPVAVVDADVATIGSDDWDALFDLAELRTLQTILQHLTAVDLRLGPKAENFDQLAKRLAEQIERRRKEIEAEWDYGGSSVGVGVITSVFASHNEDVVT